MERMRIKLYSNHNSDAEPYESKPDPDITNAYGLTNANTHSIWIRASDFKS